MDNTSLKRSVREHYFKMDRVFNNMYNSGRVINVLRFPITTQHFDECGDQIGLITPLLIVKTDDIDVDNVILN